MKLEEKRIFINDLPETATQEDIKNAFENYGKVVSIEIKERKELGRKNLSLFFAYVNIQIDDRKLQQCFQDFSNGQWLGEYIPLQIARESFLERLRKERENNVYSNKNENNADNVVQKQVPPTVIAIDVVRLKRQRESPSESGSSDSSDSERIKVKPLKIKKCVDDENISPLKPSLDVEENKLPDFIIKSNKGKIFDKTGLKIPSVGKEPIVKIDLSKKKVSSSEDNLKRLESLKSLKKGYQNQKLMIRTALANVDHTFSKKIIYDDSIRHSPKQAKSNQENSKKSLFEENDSEDEFETNFSIKEQFQGKKGQKLLELQSRYKNDKRFNLDSRFLEPDDTEMKEVHEEDEDISLVEEKNKEYEILEKVLGKRVQKMQNQTESQQKKMLRFDPSQPEHSKYEIPKGEKMKKKNRKYDDDLLEEKKVEEKEAPEVSKEIFYKVPDNFKETLQTNNEFSFMSMFGKPQEIEEQEEEQGKEQPVKTKKLPNNELVKEKNPFRYDSSDDEDEKEDISTPNDTNQQDITSANHQTVDTRRNFMWKPGKEKTEFTKLRRNLKEIVKAKVKNNQRKNKLFKKKLGGSRKKKVIKLKKAMKR
nr:nucleolar protein 8 [Leptinotarsa decemlineata]